MVFKTKLSLKAGQKCCRMLQEHSAILLIFIKLPFVIKIFVLSIFEWPFYTGFTVFIYAKNFDRKKIQLKHQVNLTQEYQNHRSLTHLRHQEEEADKANTHTYIYKQEYNKQNSQFSSSES